MSSCNTELYLNKKFTQESLDDELEQFQKYYTVLWNHTNFDSNTSDYTAAHFNKIQTTCFDVSFCKEETFRNNVKNLSEHLSATNYLSGSYCEIPNPVFQKSWQSLKSKIPHFSTFFVYEKMRYLLDILKPYQTPNINTNNIMQLKVPHTFYPIYISLLINVSHFNKKWIQLKEYILEDIKRFSNKPPYGSRYIFYDCNPKDYIYLCDKWLEWFLPNKLYELAIYFDKHKYDLKDTNYNFVLLINDICNNACFKTSILQNKFYQILLERINSNASTSVLVLSSNNTMTDSTISESDYTIFSSLYEEFYSWEDNKYQTYLSNTIKD